MLGLPDYAPKPATYETDTWDSLLSHARLSNPLSVFLCVFDKTERGEMTVSFSGRRWKQRMAGGSPMSAGEGRRWRRRAVRAPAFPLAPMGCSIMIGGGPWPPGHASRRLGGGHAGSVGLWATRGLVGDRGGAQGQRWRSSHACDRLQRRLHGGGGSSRRHGHPVSAHKAQRSAREMWWRT
jgi:hypothetical protein